MTTMTTTEPLDTDLLRQVHAGRADAFTALYRRHQGPLYRYALMRCGSSDTAADVVQEAFMGLLTGRLRFDPLRGQLQHFLFGVARKLILKVEESRGRHVALPDAGEDDGVKLELALRGRRAARPRARQRGRRGGAARAGPAGAALPGRGHPV